MTKVKRKVIQISVSTAASTWCYWALCDDGTIWARVNNGGYGENRWVKIKTDEITNSP
jgi:predicted Rdx family selenoprotein